MGFAEIIGHDRQLSTLRSALASNRLHHAYFFAGPEGVGKRSIAIALAKAVHCMQLDDDFCGECVNCARISDGNHPDVRFVEPGAGKKEISIQQVRELERDAHDPEDEDEHDQEGKRGREPAVPEPRVEGAEKQGQDHGEEDGVEDRRGKAQAHQHHHRRREGDDDAKQGGSAQPVLHLTHDEPRTSFAHPL